MAELLWSPQDQVGHASWGFAQQSRIGRFLSLSAAAHVVVAALSPWLLLTFALSGREEQLLIRTVDFFPPPETAPLGPSPETRGRAGGGAPPPKAAVRKAPVTPAAPAAPAPSAEPAPASPPAPVPEPPVPTGPSGPRDLPAVPTDPRAAWQYPENLGGTTQTVKLGFSLRLDGAVGDVRVVSSTSGILNDSALAAVRKAAPFPPLPAKFRSLVGQPLVMSFTVTIK
jgi:TonB family protein